MLTRNLQIRRCRPADVDRVNEIREACFPVEREYNFVSSGDNLVAIKGGKILAIAGVTAETPNTNWVDSIAVDPRYQRLGIASELVRSIWRSPMNPPLHQQPKINRRLFAAVRAGDLQAQLFFRACGFRAVRTSKKHFFDSDAYVFRFHQPATAELRKAG